MKHITTVKAGLESEGKHAITLSCLNGHNGLLIFPTYTPPYCQHGERSYGTSILTFPRDAIQNQSFKNSPINMCSNIIQHQNFLPGSRCIKFTKSLSWFQRHFLGELHFRPCLLLLPECAQHRPQGLCKEHINPSSALTLSQLASLWAVNTYPKPNQHVCSIHMHYFRTAMLSILD